MLDGVARRDAVVQRSFREEVVRRARDVPPALPHSADLCPHVLLDAVSGAERDLPAVQATDEQELVAVLLLERRVVDERGRLQRPKMIVEIFKKFLILDKRLLVL